MAFPDPCGRSPGRRRVRYQYRSDARTEMTIATNNRSPGRICSRAGVSAVICLVLCTSAAARVTQIKIDSRSPAFANQSFGATGPYEILKGRVFGEVDPTDRRNAIIQDIQLAPRNG